MAETTRELARRLVAAYDHTPPREEGRALVATLAGWAPSVARAAVLDLEARRLCDPEAPWPGVAGLQRACVVAYGARRRVRGSPLPPAARMHLEAARAVLAAPPADALAV